MVWTTVGVVKVVVFCCGGLCYTCYYYTMVYVTVVTTVVVVKGTVCWG